ncbi:hypothetical protein Acr_12g0009410 [Actinidia rufa]|uniref:Uncharacterized protein n=1 Tax=Actinidia rufa TaxID=165716 RepID=A0A7J0FI77_9ERIC|nr:hypothetical protein Acr_12g0009410 [Actinidia rufa]
MESAEISEGLNEWEQIQSPSHQPPSSAASGGATTTAFPPVVIRDHHLRIHDGFPIFPPNNHEGLPVPPQENQPLQRPTSNVQHVVVFSPIAGK